MAEQAVKVTLLGEPRGAEAITAALRASGLAVVPAEAVLPATEVRAAVIDCSSPDREALLEQARAYEPRVGLFPADPDSLGAEARVRWGLDGIVRQPYAVADLPQLLHALIRAKRDRDELLRHTADLAALLELTRSFAANGDPDQLLFEVVKQLAGRLTVERCSLVLADEARGTGWVVAASDDPQLRELRIDLGSYPEIREVLATRKPLLIDDARLHPLLDPVREHLEERGITAIAVVPMLSEGQAVGVLFLRSSARGGFSGREISFLSTVANATAVALRNAQLVGHVQRERSREEAARLAAEREVHQLRRYEEFFSHVSDGMAVLDGEGRILSLNPAGCGTLGVSAELARGLTVEELVAPESAMGAALLWRELARGGRVISADLSLLTRDGRSLTLSVSAAQLKGQHGRAILSFRDVTESREMESELRKTKEFLERLIDATADGIVACDLKGRILLFNKGAERVTGYSAADVVGRLHVDQLYPGTQARDIMRALRTSRQAGDGKLRLPRATLLGKLGEQIPVSLSAALITEGNRETASVGVFSDLRHRLRVEAELFETQQKLAVAEKGALVSELAGTAAHELNQPLTSVLGFAELLQRRGGGDDGTREALAAILREAERMAGIVRKIGRITRYETKEYVGKRRIVDLEKAATPVGGLPAVADEPAAEAPLAAGVK